LAALVFLSSDLLAIFLSVSFDFSIYTFSKETLFFSKTDFFSTFPGYTLTTFFSTLSLPSIFGKTGVFERVYFTSTIVRVGLALDGLNSIFAGVGLTSALAGVCLTSAFAGVGLTSFLAGVGLTSVFAGVGFKSVLAGVFLLSFLEKDYDTFASIGLNSVTTDG
jgi:hypothetical protein